MNKIKFHVGSEQEIQYPQKGKETWNIGAEVLIDNKKLFEFKVTPIDLFELLKSIRSGGKFEIFTCTCGYAGCAGFYEGIKVEHNFIENTTKWVFLDYYELDQYVFDKAEYKKSVEDLIIYFQKEYFNLKSKKVIIVNYPPDHKYKMQTLAKDGLNFKFE